MNATNLFWVQQHGSKWLEALNKPFKWMRTFLYISRPYFTHLTKQDST